MEPHPGPRCRNRQTQGVTWWNLNTQGAANAWELLDKAAEAQIDVITIQESQMLENEVLAFTRRAHMHGYTAQASAGPPTRDGWGKPRTKGGVITVCKRNVLHSHAFSISGNGGQATAVWIDGSLCLNVYAAHHAEQSAFLQEAYLSIQALAIDAPFFLIGDWNAEEHENPILPLLRDLGGMAALPMGPTRWNGNRVIDYGITNIPPCEYHIALLPDALSDHRLIEFKFTKPFRRAPHIKVQQTVQFTLPLNATKADFQSAFTSEWESCDWRPTISFSDQRGCDAAWQEAMTTLQNTFVATINKLTPDGCPKLRPDAKVRPKSSCLKLVTPTNYRKHAEKTLPNLQLRQLRNVLCRLREIQSYHNRGLVHPQQDLLYRKCRQVLALPPRPVHLQIAHVLNLIDENLARQKNSRIQTWKHKLLSCDRETFKWLQGHAAIAQHNIHNDGPASQSVQEALTCLRSFWTPIWNRELPCWDRATSFIDEHVPQIDTVEWEPLEPHEFAAAALKQKGRAGGLDGWKGEELALLPACFWSSATPLFRAFETSGLCPTAWREIRQTHIPKPGKAVRSKDLAIHASALRPISVLSVWYRIHATARWRSPSVQAWISRWWPATAFGGRRGLSINDALDKILDAAETGRYIGAYDYSLAFDTVDPALALYVFRRVGLPASWGNYLASTWKHQQRYLQSAGQTLPEPSLVQHSLPQGDP